MMAEGDARLFSDLRQIGEAPRLNYQDFRSLNRSDFLSALISLTKTSPKSNLAPHALNCWTPYPYTDYGDPHVCIFVQSYFVRPES